MQTALNTSLQRTIRIIILAGIALFGNVLTAWAGAGICLDTAKKISRAEGLPPHVLSSIALTESGRWDPDLKAKVAWPWTVTSGSAGKYFPTKAEAIAEVRRLQAAGVENIDVGCMQVNLRYHPDAFSSLSDAFTPEINVRYAARFLKDLKKAWKTWPEAVQHYHSADEQRGTAYEQRVVKHYRKLIGAPEALTSAPTTKAAPSPAIKATPRQIKDDPTIRVRVAQHQPSEQQRADAKAFAEAWRQKKLDAYRARKAILRDG